MPADEIVLSLPKERAFGPVAGLVLGGVAARHDLTIEVLDDLQLAIETLLEQEEDEGDVQIVLRIDESTVAASVGPFAGSSVAELEEAAGESIGLRRLLDTVVDSVTVERRTDGCWVALRKSYAATGPA